MKRTRPIANRASRAPLGPAVATEIYDEFWRFAAERQAVFFRRFVGLPAPWTTDPVLSAYKFTNAYRASDRVSQYLLRNVIYREDLPDSADEVCFRIILFKLFNKIETWELLEKNFGAITYDAYSFRHYDRVLTKALERGDRIYSGAYIMPPGGRSFGHSLKHRNHLALLERMLSDSLPSRVQDARSMQVAFELLRDYPTIGDFLAYQFVTDLNYSRVTDFSEMEFVVAGPGARDGMSKCFSDFGGLNEAELIRLIADIQSEEFRRLGLEFLSLGGRPLQLIDCQNLFCEISKHTRVSHPSAEGIAKRTRIKQRFKPTEAPIAFWYPPKWAVNGELAAQIDHLRKLWNAPGLKNDDDTMAYPYARPERYISKANRRAKAGGK